MDASKRKEDPSLPPDYVSLAQLQERWIQKQQKKKEEEEKKEKGVRARNENQNQRALKNDGHEKMAGLSLRDEPRRRVEKDGREMGVIADKGKGKEIVIGDSENGDEKKRRFRKKKSAAVGDKGNEVGKEKFRSEIREFGGVDLCEGVEILPRDEVKIGISGLKGIKEKVSASMVEVSPRYGVRAEISDVKRMDFRSGLRRNGDNWGSGYKSKQEYRVRFNELKEAGVKVAMEKKMEDEKGYDKKLRERRNGDHRVSYHGLESRADNLKVNEVELESENKAKNETSEVHSKSIGGLNGRNKTKEHRVEGKVLNDDNREMVLEKKVNDEVLMAESVKNDEKGRLRKGYRRHRNWSGNIGRKFGGLTYNDWKIGNVISRDEVNVGYGRRYARYGRFEDRKKMKERESGMMWVKKEEKSGAQAGTSGISVDQE